MTTFLTSATTSFSVKRKAVDLMQYSQRLVEELPYIQKEMRSLILYYRRLEANLKTEIKTLEEHTYQV